MGATFGDLLKCRNPLKFANNGCHGLHLNINRVRKIVRLIRGEGMKVAIRLVITLLVTASALVLVAARSNAQTLSEYSATINGAGALDSASQGMSNYSNDTDFRPSEDYRGMDYRSDLDTSSHFADSTDYAPSGVGGTTDYQTRIYSTDNFTSSTDYNSDVDYRSPTDFPH
jgi:hypothetical protein